MLKTLRFLARLKGILPHTQKERIQEKRKKKARIKRIKMHRKKSLQTKQPAQKVEENKWDITLSLSAPFPGFEHTTKISLPTISDEHIENLAAKLFLQLKTVQTDREIRSATQAYSSIEYMVKSMLTCKVMEITSHTQDMLRSEEVLKEAKKKLIATFSLYRAPIQQKTLLEKVKDFFK